MVFRAAGTKTFKLRVDHSDGRHAVLSTECTEREDADYIEAVVRRWQGKHGKKHARPDVIDALVSKRVKLAAAVDALDAGTLDALLEANPAAGENITLSVLLWHTEKSKSTKGGGQAATYLRQLKTLFPEIEQATFTLSVFTRKILWERLDALEVDGPTKNRYRAAASSFAKYLVKREAIDRNFVRDIEGFGENDPRLVYYEIPDAKRLLSSIEHETVAGMSAAALGFCAEISAVQAAFVSDFDLEADPPVMHVRGTKRGWRDRFVPLVDELRFVIPYIKKAIDGKMAGAKAFDDISEWIALDTQRRAADLAKPKIVAVGEAEYGQHSFHDWRHTHAVALLRWGYSEQIAADHLGHKGTSLVRDNYGRFKSTKHDYAKAKPVETPAPMKKRAVGSKAGSSRSATTPITIPLTSVGRRRVK